MILSRYWLLTFFIYLSINKSISQVISDNTRKPIVVTIQPIIGMNQSRLHFSIAGNEQGTNPNILSELKWWDIKSIQYGFNVRVKLKKYIVEATYYYNKTFNGKGSDIDYADDNRKGIFSELYFESKNGLQQKTHLSTGYQIFHSNSITVSTLIDLNIQKQEFVINNHSSDQTPDNDQFLDSRYTNNWTGFGPKIETKLRPKLPIYTIIAIGYKHGTYNAFGNWNLRKDLAHPVSYRHHDKGVQVETMFSLIYLIGKHIECKAQYVNNFIKTRNGTDKLYLQNNDILPTKLNEICFSNNNLNLCWSYTF